MAGSQQAVRKNSPIVIGLAVFASIAAISLAQEVLKPIALAILLCFALVPLARSLERWGLPRGASVWLTVLFGMGFLGVVGFIVSRQLTSVAGQLPVYERRVLSKIDSLRPKHETAVVRFEKVISDVKQRLDEPLLPTEDRSVVDVRVVSQPTLGERLRWAIGPLLEPVLDGLLVLVLVLFLLWHREEMIDQLVRLFGHARITVTMKTIEEAGARISRYLAMLAAVNSAVGLVVGLGLWAIGVPYAALWGGLAAVLRFIPYVGPVTAFVLPFFFTLATSPVQSWRQPVEVLVLFGVLEALAMTLVEPLVYGKTTEVSPIGLLLAAMFWTWLWGILGLLLSTPLTVCLAVLGKYVPSLGFLATVLGQRPALEPHLKYYQRLLAHDRDGAIEVIENALRQTPRVDVFDTILIPALARTRHDVAREELPESDEAFIIRVTDELLDELEEAPDPAAEQPAQPHANGTPPAERRRIVGVAVESRAEALVMRMLGQVVPSSRYELKVVHETSSALRLSDVVAELEPDLIVLSLLPPGGLTQTRYLIRRLHSRLKEPPLLVGLWCLEGEAETPRENFAHAGAAHVARTLAELRESIVGSADGDSHEAASSAPETAEVASASRH